MSHIVSSTRTAESTGASAPAVRPGLSPVAPSDSGPGTAVGESSGAWGGATAGVTAGGPVGDASGRSAIVSSTLLSVRSGLRSVARAAGRALGNAIPVLLVCAGVTFALGAFAQQEPADILLGEAATPEALAALDHELGRDRPLLVQFFTWAAGAVTGDLGTSWMTGIEVSRTVTDRLPVSLSIAGLALVLAVVGGASAGVLAAQRRGGVVDRAVTVLASTVATLPPFVVSILLVVLFGVLVPVLPTGGYVAPTESVSGWLACTILPALALSLEPAADVARQVRTGLVTTLDDNFVLGARLRGLSGPRVLLRHALPAASGPALAALGIQVPKLVGGAIIAEQIFNLPGIGLMAYDGAMVGDMPVVLGAVMVTVVVVLVCTFLVDLLLGAVNPVARAKGAAA